MTRFAVLALALYAGGGGAGCGRSQGNADQDLGGLVVAAKTEDQKIDVARATTDAAELGRALTRPYRAEVAALGAHTVTVATTNTVDDGATRVSDLADQTTLELGDAGAYHATYTNSADYGREAIFVGGQLYLRPRYQRWHQRAPEAPDEPAALRDQYVEAIGATWDLLAPGAELTDAGAATIAGRAGRKIVVKRMPTPRTPAAEPLAQRKWRETRTIDAVDGEIVIDADSGLPLAVKLAGTIGFARDGRRFVMKLGVTSEVTAIGKPVAIAAPGGDDVVATPERRREVDDRDFLLQNIAPPLRKNADGTAVAPQPSTVPAAGSASGSAAAGSGSAAPATHHHKHHDDSAGSGSASAGSGATP